MFSDSADSTRCSLPTCTGGEKDAGPGLGRSGTGQRRVTMGQGIDGLGLGRKWDQINSILHRSTQTCASDIAGAGLS